MTRRKSTTEKPLHFGTISMPIAKGLYNNHNYSLIMVLLYIDSRKQKDDDKGLSGRIKLTRLGSKGEAPN